MRNFVLSALGAALLLALGTSVAWSQADVSGSVIIVEPNGFPGVCSQPCFTSEKTFEVYLAGNPTTPAGANCPRFGRSTGAQTTSSSALTVAQSV